MSLSEIADMDEVADACAVRRVIIRPENLETGTFA